MRYRLTIYAILAALAALMIGGVMARAQNSRWDYAATTTQASGGNLVPLYAIPGAAISFYSGCTALPCSTPANVYTSQSETSACPSNAQVVLQLTTTCVATADQQGNFGGWFIPALYQYTITAFNQTYGPYNFTVGSSGQSTSLPINLQTQAIAPVNSLNVPGQNYVNTFAGIALTTQFGNTASALITTNSSTFSDGSPYIQAAPQYADAFMADFVLTDLAQPQRIPTSTVLNFITKFLAHTNGNGEIPVYISQNLATIGYYSGADQYHHHATPDGAFGTPILEQDYYNRLISSGSSPSSAITQFIGDAPKLAGALNALVIDSSTGCPYITPGDERATWGFQDGTRPTGAISIDCVFYAHAAQIMSNMYGLAGNPTQQSVWNVKYNSAVAGLSSTSPLWDATDGMLLGATIQNNGNINIYSSVLAAHWGLLSSSQASAVDSWVCSHYSSITQSSTGYIRQSPTYWGYTGILTSTGGPPYACDTTHPGLNCMGQGTYDDGYWTHFFREFVESLVLACPANAVTLVQEFAVTPDPTMEYYASAVTTPANGFTNNLESPMGPAATVQEFVGLNNAVATNSLPSGESDQDPAGANPTVDITKPFNALVYFANGTFTIPAGVPGRQTTIAFCNGNNGTSSGPWAITPPSNVNGFQLNGIPAGCTLISLMYSGISAQWQTINRPPPESEYDFSTPSATTVAISLNASVNVIVLFQNMSFTIGSGNPGQQIAVAFCTAGTGGPWTMTPPSNVHGLVLSLPTTGCQNVLLIWNGAGPYWQPLTSNGSISENTVTSSATPAFSAGFSLNSMVVNQNITSWTIPAGTPGQHMTLLFCQDSAGPHTISGTPSNVAGFTVPTTANKCGSVTMTYSGLTNQWMTTSNAQD